MHIRALEKEFHRPTTILFDLQGPKLRVGHFEGGRTVLEKGRTLHLRPRRGSRQREPGTAAPRRTVRGGAFRARNILIDDGKVRLAVLEANSGRIVCEVRGRRHRVRQRGRQRPRRGRADPGADRQGPRRPFSSRSSSGPTGSRLSFVQRPEDVAEARSLIGERAALLAKIEKPAAIEHLNDIIALSDAVMVARGDLGVELPPEQVPPMQNRIVATRAAVRQAGGGRDADARIDGHLADTDPRRGQRRRHGHLRRRRRGDAVSGKRGRPISMRGGAQFS